MEIKRSAHAPPRACKPLGEPIKLKLRQMARANSEKFARGMIAAAQALETTARASANTNITDDSDGSTASVNGLEFVDSLNGIDLYEDVSHARASHVAAVSTRLRSLCHIEADVHDVVRHLTANTSNRMMPGVVQTRELCSVLEKESRTRARTASENEFPEQAGVNWFLLTRESAAASSSSPPEQSEDAEALAYECIVLSYQGVFKHRGRRGWVQWCQSIDLSSFPERAASGGPKRGVLFSSGIVAVESATRPGHVTVCYSLGLDLSVYDGQDRKFLERAVWERVMKLAALKKSMLRESLSRTLSISSPESERQSSQSSHGVVSPKVVLYEPTAEPRIKSLGSRSLGVSLHSERRPHESVPLTKSQELRTESSTATKKSDKRRVRAQTMEPSTSSSHRRSLFRVPTDSLEFRLSLYNDPDAFPEAVPLSPTVQKSTKESGGFKSLMASALKPTKGNRPKSRSMGNGWVL